MILKEKNIEKYYNLIAPFYNFLHHLQTLYADTIHRKKSVIQLSVLESEICLEIGCGTGLTTELIFNHIKNIKLICLDASERMIFYAKKRAKLGGYNNKIEFVNSSIYHMPLKDNSVDSVISVYVFGALYNPELAIKEIIRVLKPNGNIILTEMTEPSIDCSHLKRIIYKNLVKPWVKFFWKFTDHSYIDLFECNGFKIINKEYRKDRVIGSTSIFTFSLISKKLN